MLIDNFLCFRLLSVNPQIVECLRSKFDHFGSRNNIETELLNYETCPGLRHVTLVRYET